MADESAEAGQVPGRQIQMKQKENGKSMFERLAVWLRTPEERVRFRQRSARFIGRNWARVSYGRRIEPTWLELTQTSVTVRNLPPTFAGFRIVQLSDFHCSRHVPSGYLAEAIDLAQAQKPDLVVLTGDFVHRGYKYVDQVAQVLSRLSAPQGVYAVLGNHDFSVRNRLGLRRYRHLHLAVTSALSNRGVCVLQNESVSLQRLDDTIHLIGVADLWSRACDLDRAFAGLASDVPRVVLAHNPRTIERLQGRRCDLMLSGHTHGGQINWPGLGRPMLGRRGRQFAAGLYRCNETQLYVNKGVGFGFRFRFGVRPEVALLTLQPGGLARASG
jgi:predicted MPP superfamily phosphohydrolase